MKDGAQFELDIGNPINSKEVWQFTTKVLKNATIRLVRVEYVTHVDSGPDKERWMRLMDTSKVAYNTFAPVARIPNPSWGAYEATEWLDVGLRRTGARFDQKAPRSEAIEHPGQLPGPKAGGMNWYM